MKIKTLQLIIFFGIVLNILFVALSTTISSFCDFYEFENNFDISSPKLVNDFSSYTGFDTGYGFFAPNVSSNFVILSTNLKDNKILISSDLLETTEGKSRFININDIFLKNLEKSDNQKLEINHTILKQINNYLCRKYNSKFETFVYLYDYPTLHNKENKTELLIKIDSIK